MAELDEILDKIRETKKALEDLERRLEEFRKQANGEKEPPPN